MNKLAKERKEKLLAETQKLKKEHTEYQAFLAKHKEKITERFDITKNEKKTKYVQESFPFIDILEDGICQIDETHFSKSIVFEELNYRLILEELQESIGEKYKKFLNGFSPQVMYQFSFINLKGRKRNLENALAFIDKDDEYQEIRTEYRNVIKNQEKQGNNGLKHLKILTFTVESKNFAEARKQLAQIETELILNFKKMGVKSKSISKQERLELLHDCLNVGKTMDTSLKSAKDIISPETINFNNMDFLLLNERTVATTRVLKIDAFEIEDDYLEKILKNNNNIIFTIHLRPMFKREAEKKVRRKNLDVKQMIVDATKKAYTEGLDSSLIPQKLSEYREDIEDILNEFRNDEKYFETTFLLHLSGSPKTIENELINLENISSSEHIELLKLSNQQEEGLYSSLPLGVNQMSKYHYRDFITESIRAFIPFTNQDILDNTARPFYYGVNKMTNNLILADRTNLKNPNALFLGTPGSGKSFAAKREMVNVILNTDDDILIVDPEGEYFPMVKILGGTIIDLGNQSKQYLNPFEININYGDDKDMVSEKADFILSFMQIIRGNKVELSPREKTIIDRCIRPIYRKYADDPKPENLPILEDLYYELKKQGEIGQGLADELELYVHGSLNLFNHRTNVDLSKRIICFDLRNLSKNLKHLAMFIIQDQVWNKISQNRGIKYTQYYCDEFHVMLGHPLTAGYVVEQWKRFRKWGGIPTGITQNIMDFLSADVEHVETLFNNTDFLLLLNQKGQDREMLQELLDISENQIEHLKDADAGTGLIVCNGVIVPFKDDFPKDTKLYQAMTTKVTEVKKREEG